MEETMRMLDTYADFAEDYMAMPVIKGEKTESERFPGAEATWCIEAMMQDRKALQAGTSHFLGQNFSRASEIRFLDAHGKEAYAWTTSWGVSTRLIGGLIMTHSDDDGLVVPPRLAPSHVVILPVLHDSTSESMVLDYCNSLADELREQIYYGNPVEVVVDTREGRGGEKVWSWIKKGVPVYCEIGPRDIGSEAVFVGRRDKSRKERYAQPKSEFVATITSVLDDIQNNLYKKARSCRNEHTRIIDSKDELYDFFTPRNREKPEVHGGFARCHWNGSAEVEELLKKDLNVTVRCIPLGDEQEEGKCIISGDPSQRRVIMAKSY
jgi:prolyl-tRNA synthetase